MIIIKTRSAIEIMKKAGRLLAGVVDSIRPFVKQGISTLELDALIENSLLDAGMKSECKGYSGYRHATCISINDGIVHGVPSDKIVLKNGDFVKIDVVASYGGYCADMTRFFFIGTVAPVVRKIARTAQLALNSAIAKAVPGNHLSDISAEVQRVAESAGFGVVRCFAGHGIGRSMHEDPEIPNYGVAGRGPILRAGMTFAIEPMITEHGFDVNIDDDGWTARTADGGYAAHVEDTILITDAGPKILTRPGR